MPPKRKRPDAHSADGSRPSPHRPGDAHLAQHDRDEGRPRGRGGQRNNSFSRRDSSASQGGRQANTAGSPKRQNSGSQPSQAGPPTPTPPSRQSPTMKPPPPAFAAPPSPAPTDRKYQFLTDANLKGWKDGARSELVAHGIQSRDDQDIAELSNIYQELIHSVMDGRIDPRDAGSCLKEVLGDGKTDDGPFFDPKSIFIDNVALILELVSNKFRPELGEFLKESGVPVALIRQALDGAVLEQLGLTSSRFSKGAVKYSTNLLYRQANYNLLREETEGYSKLITELYLTSDVLSPDLPRETFERIKALIGTFDLDVGRVLDVTLDVSAVILVKQFRFFVKLLRVSSWWPRGAAKDPDCPFYGGLPTWATPDYPDWETSEEDEVANTQQRLLRDVAFWDRARELGLLAFFELGGRRIPANKAIANGDDKVDPVANAESQWMEMTKTLPPSGNRVAAHLLGFKLRFYYSDDRDANDVLPANLLYLAALLIKIGFISLPDLYPHLSPADDNMEQLREKKLAEIEEAERSQRGGGQMNALLRAGVLPQGDDDNPNTASTGRKGDAAKKTEAEKKEAAEEQSKKEDPPEQKLLLLQQLLTIGALPEALFILGRFPWIPEACPDVLDSIHRILHVSLTKVYRDACAVSSVPMDCPMKKMSEADQSGVPKGSVKLGNLTLKKPLKWPTPDKYDHNDNQDYRYYWDDWTDNIPVCQKADDVFTLCDTLLNISGVNIGKDPALLSKLAIIGARSLTEDASEANMARWKDLLKRLLLPALSHTKANASAVDAVWGLLRRYPITVRFALYAEWFEGQISRLPSMKSAFARSRAETRATMKRVSHTNLHEMARRLAKTSQSSPGIVFAVAFEQLEAYPNLITAFVECAKYFTDMSYDVLIWSLLSSLGKSRSRTQEDHALTTSKWLQALSRFVGKIFRRYSVLTSVPVLRYVNEQLLLGNSTDLLILRELIESMGGIVDTTDFTDQQILAMSGGEYLRRSTLIRGQDLRFESVKSSQRLIKALTDTQLAAQLLLSLAQYRQAALFQVDEAEAHIKFLSSIVDDSHRILIQYLDFLWSNVDPATFDQLVPSIPELITAYGLESSLAFLIGRTSLSHRMFPWKAKEKTEKDKHVVVDKDGDATMTTGTPKVPSQEPEPAAVQKTDDPSLIRNALDPIVDSVQQTMPSKVWEKISPELYVTFWALQLGDVFCPDASYKQEIARLKADEAVIARDRKDMTRKGQETKMEKRKELMQLQIDLSTECGEHMLRQGRWKLHLSKQFQTAIPEPRPSPESVADELLETCFLPRVLISPADAEYTYRFIKALHEWNCPGFKLMALCDRLFNANRIRSLIFASSVREAENVGRFLKLILEDLSRWHKNEAVNPRARDQPRIGTYDKEGKGTTDQPRLGFALTVDESGKPQTFVEHAQFQDMLFRWHKNLNTALKGCLAGTEWMHIRNALTVLKCILDFFPAIDFMATQFKTQLKNITEKEAASKTNADSEEGNRVDLSVAAQGALSELQRKQSKWMMVQAFRPNSVGGALKVSEISDLRPTAAEFTLPSSRNEVKKSSEAEDGEVQDASKAKTEAKTDGTGNRAPESPAESLPPKPALREPPRRDNTPARSATPKANQGPSSGARNDSRPSPLPDRPMHNLPTRPDVPIPGHYPERNQYNQPRNQDRREHRDARDPRQRDHRDSRDQPESRDGRQPREHRDPRSGWDQDMEWSERQERNRQTEARRVEAPREVGKPDLLPRPGYEKERPHRDGRGRGSELPSEQSTPQQSTPAVEPAMNPERAALFREDVPTSARSHTSESGRGRRPAPPDTLEKVNPARAALMSDSKDGTPSRPPRDETRPRGPRDPREHSPRRGGRHGVEHQHPESSDEGRLARPPSDSRPPLRHRERSPIPPGSRPQDRQPERTLADKPKDAASAFKPHAREQNYDQRAYENENYGRLNPIQSVTDIPSGPRGRGRNTRGPEPPGPNNRFGGHNASPRPPSPERHPPTGPSGGRNQRRGGYDPPSGPSAPVGPSTAVHPDRMRSMPVGPEASSPVSGVHPDRMVHVGGRSHAPAPPPPPPGHPPLQPSTTTPDRGRSEHQRQPMPTGPSDRGNGGPRGGRNQLSNINNMLQSNQPPPGRSNSRRNQPRTMLGGTDVQVLTGGSPATTPVQERPDPIRHDSAGKPPNGEESQHDGHSRSHRDHGGERSSRSSRRSSRDRERERSPGREKDGKEHREHRDRRSGAGGDNAPRDDRDKRSGRYSKEAMPPPGPGRDPRHDSSSRNRGPPKDGGSSRPEDRREDRGRKRRSEEGGAMTSEREKRQRR